MNQRSAFHRERPDYKSFLCQVGTSDVFRDVTGASAGQWPPVTDCGGSEGAAETNIEPARDMRD